MRALSKSLAARRAGFEFDVFAAQPHVSAEAFDFLLFGEDVDDGVFAVRLEFGAVGVGDAADVAGEFDDRHLEAEAQAQVGHFVFAGVADALDFAFGAAHAEPAGHDDAVDSPARRLATLARVDAGGVDPA